MTICEHRGASTKTTLKAIEERETANFTIKTVLTESDEDGRVYYSITVILSPVVNLDEDICIVHDITGSEERARQIFAQIVNGRVTPCTLEDILSDLL